MGTLARADPRLQGLSTPVRVELHEAGIGYAIGSGRDPTSVWLHTPRWWEPLTRRRAKLLHGILSDALLALVARGVKGWTETARQGRLEAPQYAGMGPQPDSLVR